MVKSTTASDVLTITTVAGTTTVVNYDINYFTNDHISGPYKRVQACNKGNLSEDYYGSTDRIVNKYFENIRYK